MDRPLPPNDPGPKRPLDTQPGEPLSIPKVTHAWYVACASEELAGPPIARTVLGVPLVLFRDGGGRPGALLDRCAHRNVPLSLGRVSGGRIECGYHGWQYDAAGTCVKVPGLVGDGAPRARAVAAFPAREQDGFIWIYATASAEPPSEPFRLPEGGEGATTVRRVVEVESSLLPALENALDVPHTAFLHRGLFRGSGETHRIKVKVTRNAERVQAEYLGEPRPQGLAARILSRADGVVTHYDRFILPSIAQVEYRLGAESYFLVTSILTPIEDLRTRIYAVIAFRTRLPGWLVRPFLDPIATRIFEQDAFILKAQTDAFRRFGGPHYTSTPIDVLGLQIARLLRRAASGPTAPSEDGPDEGWSREIEMEV